jgi:hypothetical protein
VDAVAISDLSGAPAPLRTPTLPIIRRRGVPSGAGPMVLLLLAAHLVGGHLMAISPVLATLHALATTVVVAWVALFSRRPDAVVGAAAYVAACEVLWRQTEASVPWQASTYLLIAIFAVGIVRFAPRPPRRLRAAIPIVYLVLLAPGAFATAGALGVLGSQELLGFYLGPPIVLALGVLLMRQHWTRWEALRPVLWLLCAPIFATLGLATAGAIGLSAVDFLSEESNIAASGGYGPNQVSAVVGLGAVVFAFLALKERNWLLRSTAAALAFWCLAQGALTFSRGGLINVLVAAAFALPHFLTRARNVFGVVLVSVFVFVVCGLVLLPRLQDLTGGVIESRLTSTDGSRVELAQIDVDIFFANVATGVGVGLSEEERGQGAGDYAAHTEYTRLLAEHGLFGLGALACLIWMACTSYRRSQGLVARAWTAALLAWAFAEMTHSAMRLSVTPFVFALAALAVIDLDKPPPEVTDADGVALSARRDLDPASRP